MIAKAASDEREHAADAAGDGLNAKPPAEGGGARGHQPASRVSSPISPCGRKTMISTR